MAQRPSAKAKKFVRAIKRLAKEYDYELSHTAHAEHGEFCVRRGYGGCKDLDELIEESNEED